MHVQVLIIWVWLCFEKPSFPDMAPIIFEIYMVSKASKIHILCFLSEVNILACFCYIYTILQKV